MTTFAQESVLPVPADFAWKWHCRFGAFERLQPPWDKADVLERKGGVENGATLKIRVSIGPLRPVWQMEHVDVQEGRSFRDRMLKGSLAQWEHSHQIIPVDAKTCRLRDEIVYRLPLGFLGQCFGGYFAGRKIAAAFRYRHRLTADDMNAHYAFAEAVPMKIAVTGCTGLVGSALIPFLTTGGHEILPMVRGKNKSGIYWNPESGEIDSAKLEGLDAVIHLAGENVAGGRWTANHKAKIRDSRVQGSTLIAKTLASLKNPPKTFLCASAIGYYGEGVNAVFTEESPNGNDFLATICKEWEDSCKAAKDKGIRTVNLRIGVVLSPAGGALKKMLLPFKMGVGGVVGSGKQIMSWVALDDVIGAIHHVLMKDDVRGPVNITAPKPASNREFTKTFGRVLGRPTIFPMPAFAVKLIFGEMGETLLLGSQNVLPKRLEAVGYKFRFPELEAALRHLLGK